MSVDAVTDALTTWTESSSESILVCKDWFIGFVATLLGIVYVTKGDVFNWDWSFSTRR